MKKLEEAWDWLICDRSNLAMLLRTILEAIGSYVTTNLIVILELFNLSEQSKLVIMGLCMAVYTAVIGKVREQREQQKQLTA